MHRRGKHPTMPAYLSNINPLDDPRWDEFVKRHPWGWIYHLSKWQRVLVSSFPHIKGHCLAVIKRGRIRAGLPLYSVDSWLLGRRLVSVPFGTLCDPLVTIEDEMRLLIDRAVQLSQELACQRLEVRVTQGAGLLQDDRLEAMFPYVQHFLPLQEDLEKIKKGFHRTCVRQRISRAENSGLDLIVGNSLEDIKTFFDLYVKTRRRLSLPPQPFRFFENIWKIFGPSGEARVLLALKEGKALAGLILLCYGDRVSAEFAGSDARYKDLSPNHFLFWGAIQMAKKEGAQVFDFGRTSPGNKPLMDFKRHWGTSTMDLGEFIHPRNEAKSGNGKEHTWAYRLVKTVCEKTPERWFCRVGEFCYRHLG
jgi:hypothetical protein